MTFWLIKLFGDIEGLYWSNVLGWTGHDNATRFTIRERESFGETPLIDATKWVKDINVAALPK